jgi:hypothetical protein
MTASLISSMSTSVKMAAGSLADLSGVGAGGSQKHSVAIIPISEPVIFRGVCAVPLTLSLLLFLLVLG